MNRGERMGVETLSQLFEYATTYFNKPDLLIYRGKNGSFQKISSHEFRDRVMHLALGLRGLGVKQGSKVLLLSANRPEWHITDFACHLLGAIVVPIFPSLISEQVAFILKNSEAEFVVVSDATQLVKIHDIGAVTKKIKAVIVFDTEAATTGEKPFENVIHAGRENFKPGFLKRAVKTVAPEDLATIIYTSGTTGVPKGVMLTHRNLVANMLGAETVLRLTTVDKAVSFLPLCHAFERTVDYLYFFRGMTIVYSASMEELGRDLRESAPSVMACVPRFYEKIKAKVEAKAVTQGGLRLKIFNWALEVGRRRVAVQSNGQRGGLFLKIECALAHRLVFSKIQAGTGGKIRFFVSGGAPLSAEVAKFFSAVGLPILEGYGLTETAPVISVNSPQGPKPGTVGRLLPEVEVKIAEDGEILTRGPNVMLGYYKMPEETARVMTDGWFHTGDIGHLDEEGYLVITDRKKQLIVTSVGKKIAPQAIELAVEASSYIEQVVLIGEKQKFITALIVPDFEHLKLFARENHLAAKSAEDLIKEPAVVELIQKEVEKHQGTFSHYEQIQKFRLLAHPFSVENGMLTPTMKVKRKAVVSTYAALIEQMYAAA